MIYPIYKTFAIVKYKRNNHLLLFRVYFFKNKKLLKRKYKIKKIKIDILHFTDLNKKKKNCSRKKPI